MAILTIRNTSCLVPLNCVEYGYLYNWYAATDARNIANTGWHVMTWDDMLNLINHVTGGSYTSLDASDSLGDGYGGELKKTGTTYWQNPNINATDEYGFGAVGGGLRVFGGSFLGLNEFFSIYTFNREQSNPEPPHDYEVGSLIITNSTTFGYDFVFGFNQDSELFYGRNLRLVSDTPATGLPDGTTGIYTGNDGKNYSTVVINEKWWLAKNLAETKYRNGDPIPTVEDNATWVGLTTGAKCAYENNYSYVGCGETAPTTTTTTTTEPVLNPYQSSGSGGASAAGCDMFEYPLDVMNILDPDSIVVMYYNNTGISWSDIEYIQITGITSDPLLIWKLGSSEINVNDIIYTNGQQYSWDGENISIWKLEESSSDQISVLNFKAKITGYQLGVELTFTFTWDGCVEITTTTM